MERSNTSSKKTNKPKQNKQTKTITMSNHNVLPNLVLINKWMWNKISQAKPNLEEITTCWILKNVLKDTLHRGSRKTTSIIKSEEGKLIWKRIKNREKQTGHLKGEKQGASHHLSTGSLSINELNFTKKRYRLNKGIKKNKTEHKTKIKLYIASRNIFQ